MNEYVVITTTMYPSLARGITLVCTSRTSIYTCPSSQKSCVTAALPYLTPAATSVQKGASGRTQSKERVAVAMDKQQGGASFCTVAYLPCKEAHSADSKHPCLKTTQLIKSFKTGVRGRHRTIISPRSSWHRWPSAQDSGCCFTASSFALWPTYPTPLETSYVSCTTHPDQASAVSSS